MFQLTTSRLASHRAHRLALLFNSSVVCRKPAARALKSWSTSSGCGSPKQRLQLITQSRHLSTSRLTGAALSTNAPSTDSQTQPIAYHGPLTQTFRRLKIFSLSSLGLSCIMTPFIFIVESSLPMSARIVLAATALSTSSISTALVGWSGASYVVDLQRLSPADNGGIEGIEMTTLTLTLKRLVTRVYDADFLVDTKRPFSKWELAQSVLLPPSKEDALMAEKGGVPGEEETIAETFNATGEIVGRWIVKWENDGRGTCRGTGKVVRYAILINFVCRNLTLHAQILQCARGVAVTFVHLRSLPLCYYPRESPSFLRSNHNNYAHARILHGMCSGNTPTVRPPIIPFNSWRL